MQSTKIVWNVPEDLYRELESAQQELAFPSVVDLVAQAVQRYLAELQRQDWQ